MKMRVLNSLRFLNIIITGEVSGCPEKSNQKVEESGKHKGPPKELLGFT